MVRPCTLTEGPGSIPGQGTKIPQAARHSQIKEKKRKKERERERKKERKRKKEKEFSEVGKWLLLL